MTSEAQPVEESVRQRTIERHRRVAPPAAVVAGNLTVEDPPEHLRVQWPRLREELLAGRYQPQPVLGESHVSINFSIEHCRAVDCNNG